MTVSGADISKVFDELLAGERSRESAEAWAWERMRAADERELTYEPRSDEALLRDGLHYLAGVALRSAPNEYLHSDDDFRTYRESAGL